MECLGSLHDSYFTNSVDHQIPTAGRMLTRPSLCGQHGQLERKARGERFLFAAKAKAAIKRRTPEMMRCDQ